MRRTSERGGAATRARSIAVREALEDAAIAGGVTAAGAVAGPIVGRIAPAGDEVAGPAAGGVARAGHAAAAGMAAPHGSMIAFNNMLDSYLAHLTLADATARTAALRERGPFKPAQVEPFSVWADRNVEGEGKGGV